MMGNWGMASHCKADSSCCQGIGSQASGKDLICNQNRLYQPDCLFSTPPFMQQLCFLSRTHLLKAQLYAGWPT